MLLHKIWSYIIGYVSVTVDGSGLEKFINMAISRGIYLWDITRVGQNRFVAKVRLSGFRGLRHIGKRVNCKVKISNKAGAPFLMAKMKRRRMLLVGALLFLIAIYGLSTVVWFVDVQGEQKVAESKILADAAQAGLTRGVAKRTLDINAIEKHLTEQNPRLAWAGVQIKGSKVIIEVRERKIVEEDPLAKAPADIVASKKGLIREVLVLAGRPMVKEGDNVEKGEVLISGWVYDPDLKSSEIPSITEFTDEPEPQYNKLVHADGIVRARTWYQGYGEAKLVEDGWRASGKSATRYSIKIGSREIIVKGPEKLPKQKYETKVEVKRLPTWRNIRVPVEVIQTKYIFFEPYHLDRNNAQARQAAEKQAMVKINQKLDEKAKILQRQVEEVPSNDDNLVRINVKIEALENIGQKKYYSKQAKPE